MKTIALGALAAVAALLVACGPDDDGATGSLSMEQYSNQFAAEACDYMFGCCPDGMIFMPNETACQGFLAGFTLEELEKGSELGWLTYDSDAAGACIDAMHEVFSQMSCDAVNDFELDDASATACEQAIQGHQGEGDSCEIDAGGGSTTSSSSFCSGSLECLDGVCQARVAVGDACTIIDWDDPCVAGSYCADGTCAAHLEAGAACTFSDVCADGLYCSDMGTCDALLAAGEACSSSEACVSGDCAEGTCAEGSACM